MRAIAMGVLALLATSCAPVGVFDLAPRETSASSRVGSHWVGTESSQATVSASFERTWLDHLLFEVEVINQSDSMLVVDPAQFSLTLSGPTDAVSPKPPRRIAPESPAQVLARLERESSVGPGLSDAALGLTAVVFAAVIVAAVVAGNANLTFSGTATDSEPENELESPTSVFEPDRDRWGLRRSDAGRALDESPVTLLQATELPPGRSVRGEIWFSARELRRVLGPRTFNKLAGDMRITAGPRRAADCALTLQAPAVLGGQEIDYFAWSE
jgi:hypothetical protein